MMRFDNFTEKAQKAAQLSLAVRERYRHQQIDVEHMLLAFLEQPFGTIPILLSLMHIDPKQMEEQLDAILRAKRDRQIFRQPVDQIYITPRIRDMILAANAEALSMQDKFVSTEHMFLGMLVEKDTPLAKMLASASINAERVKAAMLELRKGAVISDPQAEDRFSPPQA